MFSQDNSFQTSIMKYTRQRYLDIVKGISILSITFIHYEDGLLSDYANGYIGMFMIAMFYFVAGWIDAMNERKLTLKEFCRKRWQQLGKPYIYWTIIILAFDSVLYAIGYYDTYFMAREIYKSVILRGIGTLWFLPALFGGEILWQMVKRKPWEIVLAVIVSYTYQHFYYLFFSNVEGHMMQIIEAPFRVICSVTTAYILIAVGYYSYKLMNRVKLKRWGNLSVGALLFAVSFVTLQGSVFQHFQSIIECIALVLLFKSLPDGKLWNYFDYWGRNSLALMVTHYSITLVLSKIVVTKMFHVEFTGWVTIYAFVVSMVISYFFALALNRYFPYLIARHMKYRHIDSNIVT